MDKTLASFLILIGIVVFALAVASFSGHFVYETASRENILQPSISDSIQSSVSDSIVKISSVYGQGSGVIVERSEGFITIITAGHCLTDPDSIPVFTVTADNGWSVEIPVESIYVDPAVDLGVCRVPIDDSFVLSAVPMGHKIPGDIVTVIGYGLFGDKITTRCYIAIPPTKGVLTLDGTVNPGNSGCPVFNDNSEIVGIVFAKVVAWGFEGVGIAYSSNICLNVLERYRILQGLE